MKHYVFTGTWSWECDAENLEEATEKFNNSPTNEVEIDWSINNCEEYALEDWYPAEYLKIMFGRN